MTRRVPELPDKSPPEAATPPPILSDDDIYLHSEGTHHRLYEKLGAQISVQKGVEGVSFAVWAPAAAKVSVVGSFNGWKADRHPMTPRGTSGLWEAFIPGLQPGALYKYFIRSRMNSYSVAKADPWGFQMEVRPLTASVVADLSRYVWNDREWMAARRTTQALNRPLSIYEVHLGSWKREEKTGAPDGRWLTYRELAEQLVPYVRELGFTHIELMPITEHPYDGSWGYQIVGAFAPTSRFGTPDDFRHFIDAAHQAGLGVILDWVPAHFPKDEHGLGFFDGTHLYEHADPRQGEHKDWGTLVYNYGRREVSGFLVNSALFWLDRYHIDGLRVDAVASMLYLDYSRNEGEWVPNRYGGRENLEAVELIKAVNVVVHEQFPDVLTIAEESTSWPMVSRPVYLGGLGFDLKWNMGWMHDMLEYMKQDPVFRKGVHGKLTFSIYYAFTENFLLPLSHDEVVHGKGSLVNKMPGDYWKRFANLRALIAYMYAHPGKKLLFMGSELAQWKEWNHDGQLDWMLLDFDLHRKFHDFMKAINRLYLAEPSLWQVDFTNEGFQWIDFRDVQQSIVAFYRKAMDPRDHLVMVANFTPVMRDSYRIGVPHDVSYRVALNSDAEIFGGTSQANGSELVPVAGEWQEQPQSITMSLPPLAVVFLTPSANLASLADPAPTAGRKRKAKK
ncbi:MAG: 1,4-alpha-glucan branching protein GlgB [Candidatus Eisenbacteria bacterium]|nr:1,4-alpha-glucan branching protein GlgB [Candidatus Eisenbacteria bacterium]